MGLEREIVPQGELDSSHTGNILPVMLLGFLDLPQGKMLGFRVARFEGLITRNTRRGAGCEF
jgi:hypothetical protein